MTFKMIDCVKWFLACQGYCLAGHQSNNQSANKPWSRSCGYGVNIVERQMRFVQCLSDKPVEHFNVSACGNFRHDTAIGRVLFDLA